jgi:hypothetical protein
MYVSLEEANLVKTGKKTVNADFLDGLQLLKLRTKAMRVGAWFRGLSRIDRALVDLTIKVADSVRSSFLAQRLLVVTRKLEGFLEGRFSRMVVEVGLPLARRLSNIAQEWGNKGASAWADDMGFARYWAVMSNGSTVGFHG